MLSYKFEGHRYYDANHVDDELEAIRAELAAANEQLAKMREQLLSGIAEESRWCCCGDCPPKAATVAAVPEPMIGPTYYVRHPDESYSVANPQPILYPEVGHGK